MGPSPILKSEQASDTTLTNSIEVEEFYDN